MIVGSDTDANEAGSFVAIGTDGGETARFTDTGRVGIWTSSPAVPLQVLGGTDVALGGGGYLVTGDLTGLNIAIDNNESMARSNGSIADLLLQNDGGQVGIGTGPTVALHVDDGSDASLAAGSGYFLLGDETGTNLVIDNNEIMARDNMVAADLFLQAEGGNVVVGTFGSTKFQIDDDGIDARDDASASTLFLQAAGGDLQRKFSLRQPVVVAASGPINERG